MSYSLTWHHLQCGIASLHHLFRCTSSVQIWHLQDQCCLFTADPKASGIHGDVSACAYSPAMKCLYIAADCMTVLPLKLR